MADSSQFIIEMAAKLTGGDTSIAALAALGDKMLAAGSSAVELEKTAEKMSAALRGTSDALGLANSALDQGEAKYKQAEIAADRAAKAVEKLNASGKTGDAFVARQAEAAEKAGKAAAALKLEAVAVDALKSRSSAAAAAQDSLSKGLKNVQVAAVKAAEAEAKAAGTGNLSKLSAGLGAIGGPAAAAGQRLAQLGEGFAKIGTTIGELGPYVAAAVAIIAIASSAVVATYAIAKWGVSMADANRTTSFLSAGVARSVAGGAELDATIGRLGDVVPQTSDELRSMAGELAATGLRGAALSTALEAAAVKAAQLKFGPDFAKQMLALDVQAARLHTNIAGTFGGLKIEGLLGGMHTLVALFDSSTESGKAMKFIFEALFQPIIDNAATATTKIERFFLYGEILALKAFIALKPYRSEIEEVGKALLVGAAILAGVFALALGLVIGTILLAVTAIGAVVTGLYELAEAIPGVVGDALAALNDWILKFADMGGQIIDGLINGITSKAAEVADALTGVVKGGVASVEKFLHIGSPSKLLFDLGANTSAGFESGVDAGAPDAQSALENMVAPPAGAAPSLGGARAGANVTINISVDGSGESGEGLAQMIADKVREIFDSDALSFGAGEEPAF